MRYKLIPSFLLLLKYKSNAKYLTKDLRGGYNANDFSLLDECMNNKRLTVKIKVGFSPFKKIILFASIKGL